MSHRVLGMAALLLALVLPAAWAQGAAAASTAVRGWLRFADGNAVSGLLLRRTANGGVVQTDRFGELAFTDADARFEPEQPAAAPPAPAEPASAPSPAWVPAEWSLRLAGDSQQKNGSASSDLSLDLEATWRGPRNEVKLSLSTDYRVEDNEVDNNEQSGALRWVRKLRGPWVALGTLKLERSTLSIDPLPDLDYVLGQSTVGLGWQRAWSDQHYTLLALNAERVALDLRILDRRIYTGATSVLFENRLRLGPRLNLDNTLLLYRWRGGRSGIDSDTELSYDLTRSIRLGLRHEWRERAVDLDGGEFKRLSLTTRLAF
jgi:hypothetical protein